jgi:uncharacterized protein YjgD (DUF1641 family)
MGEESRTDSLKSRLESEGTQDLLLKILDRLDTIQEWITVDKALIDIGSNSMVERLAESAERSITLLDRVSDPALVAVVDKLKETEAIVPALERLAPLVHSGGLDMLVEIGTAAAAINRMMTDGLLERLISRVEKVSEAMEHILDLPVDKLNAAIQRMDEVGGLETLPDVMAGVVAFNRILNDQFVERLMVTLEHWISEVEILYSAVNRIPDEEPTGSGIFGMLSLMGDAENQKAMHAGLELIKAIRAARH